MACSHGYHNVQDMEVCGWDRRRVDANRTHRSSEGEGESAYRWLPGYGSRRFPHHPRVLLSHIAPQPVGWDRKQHHQELISSGMEQLQLMTEQQQKEPERYFDDQRAASLCTCQRDEQRHVAWTIDGSRASQNKRSLTKLYGERSEADGDCAQASALLSLITRRRHPTSNDMSCGR